MIDLQWEPIGEARVQIRPGVSPGKMVPVGDFTGNRSAIHMNVEHRQEYADAPAFGLKHLGFFDFIDRGDDAVSGGYHHIFSLRDVAFWVAEEIDAEDETQDRNEDQEDPAEVTAHQQEGQQDGKNPPAFEQGLESH